MEAISTTFNARKGHHNIDFNAKDEQLCAAKTVADGRNCIRFLPTGFGKTLCFAINTMLEENPSITLVVSPLISLMDNQKDMLCNWNMTCARIGSDTSAEQLKGIANGEYQFVFVSPETALKPKCRSIFMNAIWQKQMRCLVFDEAHCISDWGEDFRPEYREMAQLRSFFKVPVMALTVTSTIKIKQDIMSVLQLSHEDTSVVSKSPNRENIYIHCQKKETSDFEEELKWLSNYLIKKGKGSKKIIIYCRSIDTVSDVFMSIKKSLGQFAYIDRIETSSNSIVEMFHKCTHESSKKRILSEFIKPNSNIRCLVATVALGMGIDIKDVDMILYIGCPKSVISYWQEAGRCARDGRQGISVILYDNFTAALKTTDKCMADIVKSSKEQCVRQSIMNYFNVGEITTFQNAPCTGCTDVVCKCDNCTCCSQCSDKCPCSVRGVMCPETFLDLI